MTQETLPAIPKELLDALDEMFPEKVPSVHWSDREVWIKVGQRNVIRFLLAEFERQNEGVTNVFE